MRILLLIVIFLNFNLLAECPGESAFAPALPDSKLDYFKNLGGFKNCDIESDRPKNMSIAEENKAKCDCLASLKGLSRWGKEAGKKLTKVASEKKLEELYAEQVRNFIYQTTTNALNLDNLLYQGILKEENLGGMSKCALSSIKTAIEDAKKDGKNCKKDVYEKRLKFLFGEKGQEAFFKRLVDRGEKIVRNLPDKPGYCISYKNFLASSNNENYRSMKMQKAMEMSFEEFQNYFAKNNPEARISSATEDYLFETYDGKKSKEDIKKELAAKKLEAYKYGRLLKEDPIASMLLKNRDLFNEYKKLLLEGKKKGFEPLEHYALRSLEASTQFSKLLTEKMGDTCKIFNSSILPKYLCEPNLPSPTSDQIKLVLGPEIKKETHLGRDRIHEYIFDNLICSRPQESSESEDDLDRSSKEDDLSLAQFLNPSLNPTNDFTLEDRGLESDYDRYNKLMCPVFALDMEKRKKVNSKTFDSLSMNRFNDYFVEGLLNEKGVELNPTNLAKTRAIKRLFEEAAKGKDFDIKINEGLEKLNAQFGLALSGEDIYSLKKLYSTDRDKMYRDEKRNAEIFAKLGSDSEELYNKCSQISECSRSSTFERLSRLLTKSGSSFSQDKGDSSSSALFSDYFLKASDKDVEAMIRFSSSEKYKEASNKALETSEMRLAVAAFEGKLSGKEKELWARASQNEFGSSKNLNENEKAQIYALLERTSGQGNTEGTLASNERGQAISTTTSSGASRTQTGGADSSGSASQATGNLSSIPYQRSFSQKQEPSRAIASVPEVVPEAAKPASKTEETSPIVSQDGGNKTEGDNQNQGTKGAGENAPAFRGLSFSTTSNASSPSYKSSPSSASKASSTNSTPNDDFSEQNRLASERIQREKRALQEDIDRIKREIEENQRREAQSKGTNGQRRANSKKGTYSDSSAFFPNGQQNSAFSNNNNFSNNTQTHQSPLGDYTEQSPISRNPYDPTGSGEERVGRSPSSGTGGGGQSSSKGARSSGGSGGDMGGAGSSSKGASPLKLSNGETVTPNDNEYEIKGLIPHGLLDSVNDMNELIMLLGLEGKRFKTVEGVKRKLLNGNIIKVFIVRTYDMSNEDGHLFYDAKDEVGRKKLISKIKEMKKTKEGFDQLEKLRNKMRVIETIELTEDQFQNAHFSILNKNDIDELVRVAAEEEP